METKKEPFIITVVEGKTKNNKTNLLQYVGEECDITMMDDDVILYVHDREIARYTNPKLDINMFQNDKIRMKLNGRSIHLTHFSEDDYYPSDYDVAYMCKTRSIPEVKLNYYSALLYNRRLLKNADIVNSDSLIEYDSILNDEIKSTLGNRYLRLTCGDNIDDLYVYDEKNNNIVNVWFKTICVYNISDIRICDDKIAVLDYDGRYIKFNIFDANLKVINMFKNNISLSSINYLGNVKSLSISNDMDNISFVVPNVYSGIDINSTIYNMYVSGSNVYVLSENEVYIFTIEKKYKPTGMYDTTNISIEDSYNGEYESMIYEAFAVNEHLHTFNCTECNNPLEYDHNHNLVCRKCNSQYNLNINLRNLSYNLYKFK